jgi:glycosyltransferase involved in cell wall biosynthesis
MYQLVYDLQAVLGSTGVDVLPRPSIWRSLTENHPTPTLRSRRQRLQRVLTAWLRRVQSISENPFNIGVSNGFSIRHYLSPPFISSYEARIRATKPSLAVIDHVGFEPLVMLNKRYGIPTAICPQNIESLDVPTISRRFRLPSTALNWANEMRVLEACDRRLMISKVETSIITGLGCPAEYYPYVPVGDIREELLQIREQRNRTAPSKGLFLMLGSAFHRSTQEGMSWVLEQVRAGGLPSSVRIVVVGARSVNLVPDGVKLPNVEIRGWVDQDQLRELLLSVQGVLIPQFRGFGVSTKLIELAHAGIPVVAATHLMFTVEAMGKIYVAERDWNAWLRAMESIVENRGESTSDERSRDGEDSALQDLVRRVM